MKKFLQAFIVLLFLSIVLPPVQQASAQAKDDNLKTTSRLSLWFGKMKSKCEKGMEWVANSQVGQFVGDGIKYAKEGMKFAQDQYNAAMDLYNETKDAVLNSKEYKAAMISKDIATETLKLKKIQEEQLQRLEEIKQQEELVKKQAEGKIAAVKANLDRNEQRMLAEEAGTGGISPDAQSFMQDSEKAITEIQKETAAQIASLGQESLMFVEETKDRLLEQGDKIAGLTTKLNEVMSDGKKASFTRPAKEVIQEQQDALFLKANEKADLIVEKKKKTARKKALSKSIDSGLQASFGKTKLKKKSSKDKIESKTGMSATMTGESEVSGVNVEVLSEQMSQILNYIELNLAYVKTQAAAEINQMHELGTAPATDTFNLCSYSSSDDQQDAISCATDKVNSVQQGIGNGISKMKETKETIQSKGEEFKNKIEEGKQVLGDIKDVGQGLSEAGSGIVDSVKGQANSALTGMN